MHVVAYDGADAVDGRPGALRATCPDADHAGPVPGHPRDYQAGSTLMRAMASPVRLALLHALTCGDRCVHELIDHVGLPQTLVSQQLRILKEAGLVAGHRRGREVVYCVADQQAAALCQAVVALRRPAG